MQNIHDCLHVLIKRDVWTTDWFRVWQYDHGCQVHICSFLFLHFPWNFSPSLSLSSSECEKKWARKNNKKVITYLIIFSLGMLLHLLVLLIGFVDLSPINNDNNHQRQAQVANTIANQPISILGRYDTFMHNHWSLLKMRSIREVWQENKREKYYIYHTSVRQPQWLSRACTRKQQNACSIT